MTRTAILAHYKKFFEMEHLMIDAYDELMIDWAEDIVKNCTIPLVSKSIAIEYAEFCIRCDREKLPLLCLEDYIKQYCG